MAGPLDVPQCCCYTWDLMRKALLLLAACLVFGCGGGGGHGSATPANPFMGSYAGSWTLLGSGPGGVVSESGTVALIVDRTGVVTGTLLNSTLSDRADVSGSITLTVGDSLFNGSFDYDAHATDVSVNSTVTLTAQGALAGPITVTRAGYNYEMSFTLPRQ